MEEYLTQSQKIKVTCIVRSGNRILLLRSNQVANPEHQPRGGYFDIPSFTVSFGEDPKTTLEQSLARYLGVVTSPPAMLDVRQYLADNGTTQIFEMLFSIATVETAEVFEQTGRMMFVETSELSRYMFPTESTHLQKYLQ